VIAGDWNGDGLTDIALIATASGGTCYFYVSTGTGFTQMSFTPAWGGSNVNQLSAGRIVMRSLFSHQSIEVKGAAMRA
jgi:hypothetical protein